MTEKPQKKDRKRFLVSKFFPLILPKKHCLITQNWLWPFFGILSGFLGVLRSLYFGCLSLYFDNFFARKMVRSRETQTACSFIPYGNIAKSVHYFSVRKNLEFSLRPSVRVSATRFLGIPSLLYSETLQLVMACKGGKMFQALFWKNPVSPILAKNCLKLAIWLDGGFWKDAGE